MGREGIKIQREKEGKERKLKEQLKGGGGV